jgi:hypothetical protein
MLHQNKNINDVTINKAEQKHEESIGVLLAYRSSSPSYIPNTGITTIIVNLFDRWVS